MKMSATKTKLTRAEACAELAARIWPNTINSNHAISGVTVWQAAQWRKFDPFTSRDAAAELVKYFYENTAPDAPKLWDDFYCAFRERRFGDPCPADIWEQIAAAFLATPEQITLAACKALNIDVE